MTLSSGIRPRITVGREDGDGDRRLRVLYENGRRRTESFDLHDLPSCEDSKNSFVWIGLYEPTDEEFAVVRKHYRLHPLAVEDAIQAHQRPKVDVYEGSVFVVVKTAEYLADEEVVKLGEIQMFIGDGFIVHVRHGAASPLTEVRRKLEASPRRLVDGPSAVLHAIVDHVVDCYGPVVTALARDVEQVEDLVFSDLGENPVERIYMLKREVLDLSAVLEPLAQPLEHLSWVTSDSCTTTRSCTSPMCTTMSCAWPVTSASCAIC